MSKFDDFYLRSMRERLDNSNYLPRDRLIIRVSDALRSAGNAVVLLNKELRGKVADLIAGIDSFNARIETVDPGQGEKARINEPLKNDLRVASATGAEISSALHEILENEP